MIAGARALAVLILATVMPATDHFTTILERVRADAAASLDAASVAEARAWIASLPADGWWADVPQQQPGRAEWRPAQQMARAAVIATASSPGQPLAGDAAANEALVRAVAAWTRVGAVCDNWWLNEIGVPQRAAAILACRRDLPPTTVAQLEAIIGAPLDRGLKSSFTGQNLVWRAGIALTLACHRADSALAARAAQAIAGTARVVTDEGLQPDGSFHQHGAQLYSGGYGRAWTGDVTRLGAFLAGTPWAFDAASSAAVDAMLADGLAWMQRGRWLCPAVLGREVSRERGHGLGGVQAAARRWSRLRPQLADRLAGLAEPREGASGIVGAKHFWRSGYSAIHRPGFSVGILAATTRNLRTESGNGENTLGALLADGATWVRRRGDEAVVALPALDWLAVPGTVAAADTSLLPDTWRFAAESAWGGGVASGGRLVHGWNFARGGLRGAQAWFAVRDGLVCLLAGIGGSAQPVHATACQVPVRGRVRIADGELAAASTRDLAAGTAVVHDGLAWLALDAGWSAERRIQRGSWQRANINGSEAEIAVDSLLLQRRFGAAPQDASAAWAVVEADSPALAAPTWRILANTHAVQAVADADGAVLAVFRAAGALDTAAGRLAVDRPAIVLLEPQGSAWRITAADPAWTLADYAGGALRVTWRDAGIALALPVGPLAGSAVTAP